MRIWLLALVVFITACRSSQSGSSAPSGSAPTGSAPQSSPPTTSVEPGSAHARSEHAGSGNTDASVQPSNRQVIQLLTFTGYRCALMNDGRVRCWGTMDDKTVATPIELPTRDVQSISGDFYYIGLLTRNGDAWQVDPKRPSAPTLVATKARLAKLRGSNWYIVHTDGTVAQATIDGNKPIERVIKDVTDVAQLEVDGLFPCALHPAGTVTCWYSGTFQIQDLSDAVRLERIPTHTTGICAYRRGGPPRCWDSRGKPLENAPAADVVQRAGDDQHECERTKAGQLRCQDRVWKGELPATLDVPGASDMVVDPWGGCVLTEDGNVLCWGINDRGMVGDGTLMDRSTPVAVANLLDETLPPPRDGLDKIQESTTAMDRSDLPKACKIDDDIWDHTQLTKIKIVSGYAWRQEGGRTRIVIADYRLEPAQRTAHPRGKQKVLTLITPAKLGRHRDKDIVVRFAEGTRDWAPWSTEDYTITITHIDSKWLCGTFQIGKPKEKPVPQPFAARML